MVVNVLVLAISLGSAAQVIAAPDAIDQPAATVAATLPALTALPESAIGGIGVVDVAMLVLAAAAISIFLNRGWHRLRNPPTRPIVFLPEIGVLLAIGMIILGRIAAMLALQFFGLTQPPPAAGYSLDDQARLIIGQYLGQLIILIAFIVLTIKTRPMPIDQRPSSIKAALIGAGALLLAYPVVMVTAGAASLIVSLVRGQPVDPIAHETLRMFIKEPVDGWYIALGAMIIFIAPIMEEVLYRGLLQRTMVQIGLQRWWAIVFTSLGFALMHGGVAEPYALPALFVLSLAFGWAYEKTGRLSASITMHSLFNAANLAMALWTPSANAT